MAYSKVPGIDSAPSEGNFFSALHGHFLHTSKDVDNRRTSAFRFLDLPQELREVVYEELLCPHIDGSQYRANESIRDYRLEPAILRTCKQVCEEGSRVLYVKNGTFLIQMEAQAYKQMAKMLPEVSPFANVDCGKIGGVPTLTLDISVIPRYQMRDEPVVGPRTKARQAENKRAKVKQVMFIGFVPALSKFCKTLTRCVGYVNRMQLVVHMERLIGRSPEKHRQMSFDCLERLCEARGLGQVTIVTAPEHSAAAVNTATLMMTRIETTKDVVSQVHAYEARVSRQLKEQKWNDARDTLQNALQFLDSNGCGRSRSRSVPNAEAHELELKMIDMQWNNISCCLKIGRTADVHGQVRKMFRYNSPRELSPVLNGAWHRVADAHCAIGKAYVIDGFLNSALYSFLQALLTTPGHAEADEAVDDLEARVQSSSNPDEVMVRLNIEGVLEDLRHQSPGQDCLEEDQQEQVVKEFRATYREIQSLLRDPFKTGVHISIMEPWDTTPFVNLDWLST